ncbi:hypothetical protein NQ318_014141 [Aromia moschata]|uniref:C2H2-type domain-containing protein n=1 Tax=Aromia moschata TaxID=1265417 RepID=A0AAV8XKK1_9CUCU|nr:hypothetical protein NQ318_014141 [Aromia moschata]
MLTHKDISEVMTYQCAICPYKTKFKRNLTQHLLIHKDASKCLILQGETKNLFKRTHANSQKCFWNNNLGLHSVFL